MFKKCLPSKNRIDYWEHKLLPPKKSWFKTITQKRKLLVEYSKNNCFKLTYKHLKKMSFN